MDIKKFALLDWVEQDLIILQSVKTAENAADGLTKPLAKQLFTIDIRILPLAKQLFTIAIRILC